MKKIMYGYARVSSGTQKEDRQIMVLTNYGIPTKQIFIDKVSGATFQRDSYQDMILKLKEGDIVCIVSIDRLGRNYEEIKNQWRIITKDIKAEMCVLDMPLLDTRKNKNLYGSFIADIVLEILSFVAENERNNIKSRQREGIKAAKKRGVVFGRPKKELPSNFERLLDLLEKEELTVKEVAKICKMSKSTFYRRKKEIKSSRKSQK